MKLSAAVIGGVNLDVTGFSKNALIARDSNPGSIRFSPGGVGRNIAEQLAKSGVSTSLFTALSTDAQGDMLYAACMDRGIDVAHAKRSSAPTSCYLSIHDSSGDMALAVNDMALIDEITPEYVESVLPEIMKADVCVADANLSPETLAFLRAHVNLPIVADPVSCVKAPKLLALLPVLSAFKPNMLEAEALTGESDPEKAAKALMKAGVKRVVISMGERGVYFADKNECGFLPPRRVFACQTNGAGDAMCAGIAMAAAMGKSAREAALMGLKASERLLSERV